MTTAKKLTTAQRRQLATCYAAASDKMAEEIAVLDLRGITGIADFFIICSGKTDRQVQAISDSVEEKLRELGLKGYHIEGKKAGNWVLMDYHDIVVHVFHQTARAFYALDGLWGDAKRVSPSELEVAG